MKRSYGLLLVLVVLVIGVVIVAGRWLLADPGPGAHQTEAHPLSLGQERTEEQRADETPSPILMPREDVQLSNAQPSPWGIPMRILIGTSFILLLTGIVPLIGSRLTGLLTTIPLYVATLTVFAHRHQGAAAAAHVLHGLLYGLFAFAGFFIVISLLIEGIGLGVAFGSAILEALLVQGCTLLILRKSHRPSS